MTDDDIKEADYVIRRVLDTGASSRTEEREAMKFLDELLAEVKRLRALASLKLPLQVLNVGWKDGK